MVDKPPLPHHISLLCRLLADKPHRPCSGTCDRGHGGIGTQILAGWAAQQPCECPCECTCHDRKNPEAP